MAGAVDPHTMFKSIWLIPAERCKVMSDLSVLCQKGSLPPPPSTSKTHQSSQSKMSETFYLSLWAILWWLIVRWSSPSVPIPHPLSYPCINLHTMWKITNDNILKNDSQYPLAIQINNSLLLKGGSKTRDRLRRRGRDVPALLSILTFMA